MKTQLAKWGNSVAVRIAKPLADAASLSSGDVIDLEIGSHGAITIRKARPGTNLRNLVLRITPMNCLSETDCGGQTGNELP